jgi:phosphoribosylaminoimidazolecarboxamide formyltransferase/IMP cyclohydrolase
VKAQDLRYGEEPASAAHSIDNESSTALHRERPKREELSFNNIVVQMPLDFSKNRRNLAVIKHTNPCGVATSPSLVEAFRKARACDPGVDLWRNCRSNREVDADTAGNSRPLQRRVH